MPMIPVEGKKTDSVTRDEGSESEVVVSDLGELLGSL